MEEKEREKLIQVGEVFLAETLLMTAGLVETNGMFFVEITNIIYIYGTHGFII